MKTIFMILGGIALGYLAGVIIFPSLLKKEPAENDGDLHNFKIDELVTANSTSLQEIREKIEHGS